MKLIWHIFLKDLRRLRLPLVLWSAVVAMQYLVQERPLGIHRWDGNNGSVGPGILLWALHLVAAWLLVPQLIHVDPLIGDQAAWRTRPISAGRLLAAKIFGIAMMLWLWPSLLTVPWWIEFGFGPAEMVRAVAVNALGMAAFTGVALLVAVLTENFARFLAWSLVLAAAAGLGGLLLVAGMPANMEGPVSAAVLMTRASLACGLTLATVAVVVPLQFLRRRTALARGLTAGVALLVVLVVEAWPWSSAQMLAKTGLKKYELPAVTVRVADAALTVPADSGRQEARVQVTLEVLMKGLAEGDTAGWHHTEPTWRFGENRVRSLPLPMDELRPWSPAVVQWMLGKETAREMAAAPTWNMPLSGRLVQPLRDGAVGLSAENRGAIWRGERGPTVPVRAGAGAARGLSQMHISAVEATSPPDSGRRTRSLAWLHTEPLFTPVALLGMLNPDGMRHHREMRTMLMNGGREVSEWGQGDNRGNRNTLPDGTIPVGLIGVRSHESAFDEHWSRDANGPVMVEVPFEGARLTSAIFQEAAPLKARLAETAFVPNFIIEGRLDEALRRAKAEEKLVLVLVWSGGREAGPAVGWWSGQAVRDLLATRFVCVQIHESEAGVFRKRAGDESSSRFVVLDAQGEERDRLRYLAWPELEAALKANLAGKTYAATLMEELAARGGEDRKVRFQLHEALRARGELAGAFDAILWLLDHQRETFEAREVVEVGWRLEQAVATYGPAKAVLLERRERAVENLRRDARDVGAARLLFVITLGLRHDDAVWREFPRLLPRENPSWWEFMGNWISRTVAEKRYREAADGVDLEKFFAEGPAWMREQLLRQEPALAGRPLSVADWQQRLVWTGGHCVEALAGAGHGDAALRVAIEVRRIDGSLATRVLLREALKRGGATAEAERLMTEKIYGR